MSERNIVWGSVCVCSPSSAVSVLLLSDTAGPLGSEGKCWMCKYKSKRDVIRSFFLFNLKMRTHRQKKKKKAIGCLKYQCGEVDLFLHSGEPGWKSLAGCPTASLEPWKLWIPHCYRKLLQGCSPGIGCGTWSPASPAAPREHLATQKGPAPSKAAALRFPAGCSTGNVITEGVKEWSSVCNHKDCLVAYLEDTAIIKISHAALSMLGMR